MKLYIATKPGLSFGQSDTLGVYSTEILAMAALSQDAGEAIDWTENPVPVGGWNGTSRTFPARLGNRYYAPYAIRTVPLDDDLGLEDFVRALDPEEYDDLRSLIEEFEGQDYEGIPSEARPVAPIGDEILCPDHGFAMTARPGPVWVCSAGDRWLQKGTKRNPYLLPAGDEPARERVEVLGETAVAVYRVSQTPGEPDVQIYSIDEDGESWSDDAGYDAGQRAVLAMAAELPENDTLAAAAGFIAAIRTDPADDFGGPSSDTRDREGLDEPGETEESRQAQAWERDAQMRAGLDDDGPDGK